jgi:putative membrane protein
MKALTGSHRSAWLLLGLGLLIVFGVFSQTGWADVWRLLQDFGLGGTLVVVALHALPVAATTEAWAVLLRRTRPPVNWGWLYWARLVGDYVNALLPVAQIGGEVVRGVLLDGTGVSRAFIAASIMVDLTLGLLSLVVFVLLGLTLLAALDSSRDWTLLGAAMLSACAMLAAFYLLQRRGAGWLIGLSGRLFGSEAAALGEGWAACSRVLSELYAAPLLCLQATAWRLVAWLAGALEIAFALYWLDAAPGWAAVLALEAIAQVFRNAGFAIPGALGAQEMGYMAGASMVGVPVEVGLTLAVIKRARDLIIGLPVLLGWQWQALMSRIRA